MKDKQDEFDLSYLKEQSNASDPIGLVIDRFVNALSKASKPHLIRVEYDTFLISASDFIASLLANAEGKPGEVSFANYVMSDAFFFKPKSGGLKLTVFRIYYAPNVKWVLFENMITNKNQTVTYLPDRQKASEHLLEFFKSKEFRDYLLATYRDFAEIERKKETVT